MAARWASRRCTTTPKRAPCGSTSTATCRRISSAEGRMERFVYQGTPSRVVFEWGGLATLPAEVERLGARRALILATPEQRALADRVADALGARAAGVPAQDVVHVPRQI